MGRKRKYRIGTKVISLSLDIDVIEVIERLAKEHSKPVSEFVCDILRIMSQNDKEYATMMAKKYAREMNYWQGELERLKE